MKIDPKLNLVIPVDRPDGTLYVHSMPISREVFERYFLVIGKAFAAIYGEGLGMVAGPPLAGLLLKQKAKDLGVWEGEGGVERGLFAEMRRLSNVIANGPNGWAVIPFQEALDNGTFSEDEVSEVESAIAFFTVASSMHKRSELPAVMSAISGLWGARAESSSCTEFAALLRTSTATGSSGATPTTSFPVS